MPVLILTLIAVVVFIGTFLLMAFANAAEERQLQRIRAEIPGAPFRVLSVCDAFEAEYAPLWETQVPALTLVASESSNGVALQKLWAFYRRSSRQFPEIYEGTSFQQWLAFLQTAELIAVGNKRVVITKEGLDFLKFRVVAKVAA
ncbi:MAG TPA: hypothetical protein VD837_18955 [Terriglobales bacterium]|nr:hypothetical protein [Terriglobales bacterium]